MADIDKAGRFIAGLLGYNPGPGIYSRLERAVEGMPANVRVEEIPGLLKRYKEGVPGWELKEADLPGLVGDAKVIPRQDLLDRVRERSPVFTHAEVILGGSPTQDVSRWGTRGSDLESFYPGSDAEKLAAGFIRKPRPVYQRNPSALGEGVSHAEPRYDAYGQGGGQYSELLLLQPGADGQQFGSHWGYTPQMDVSDAVAHARFDTHGDALRINELQSDLGIHNRKMRERAGQPQGPPGWDNTATPSGTAAELPFPLEDAWADILIKRLALETARGGHRAIEVASPRAIADKVGGNIENYEHFYGKVVPGAIERLGRKMGGLAPDDAARSVAPTFDISPYERAHREIAAEAEMRIPSVADDAYRRLGNGYRSLIDESLPSREANDAIAYYADQLAGVLDASGRQSDSLMPSIMSLAQRHAQAVHDLQRVNESYGTAQRNMPSAAPGRRYIMSDEMRRRILTQGIGASLLAPMAMEGEE